jgi:hypothetical protein
MPSLEKQPRKSWALTLTIKTTQAKLSRAIEQGVRKAARELSRSLPDLIRERVRAGFGLNGKLKGLSKSYIAFRKGFVNFITINGKVVPITKKPKKPKLDSTTSPETSNLTATGQMLKSIIGQASGGIVRIFMKDTRKKELNDGPPKTNNEVRRFAEKDRPFFELTKNERRIAELTAVDIIKQEIRRVLK